MNDIQFSTARAPDDAAVLAGFPRRPHVVSLGMRELALDRIVVLGLAR